MLSVSSLQRKNIFDNHFADLKYFHLIDFSQNIFSRNSGLAAPSKAVSREHNLAAVLICTVTVFLVCHTPRLVLNCTELFMIDRQGWARAGEFSALDPRFNEDILSMIG